MLAPDWEEAHRIDWHSISYIPHAQAQRGSTVCGKRLTLRGEVQHDPPDRRRCPSCRSSCDLMSEPVGRDLTAQDVRDAAVRWFEDLDNLNPNRFEYIAAYLNGITRPTGDAQ